MLMEPPADKVRIAGPCPGIQFDLGGMSLAELRSQARRELLTAAIDYTSGYRDAAVPTSPDAPLLVTGHQAELFHPGVWFKNFVLSRLADQHAGVGIHLVIDSDTLHSPSVRVPTGSPTAPRAEAVRLDRLDTRLPVEELRVTDNALFESFGQRATDTIAPLIPNPLVRDWWPSVVAASRRTDGKLGLAIAQARHELEAKWGAASLEVPISHCCQLPSFQRFVAALLLDVERLHQAYNDSLAEYRRAHHLRNEAQPMPDLATEGTWLETPLWVWTHGRPQRRPLFVERSAGKLKLSNREQWTVELEYRSHERLAEQLADLAANGVKIRTRALTTTLFARTVLGDLFLHGIGGAKYDEVTDDLARRLWGCPPPGYLTLSATLQLPIEHRHVGDEQIRSVQHQLRDCQWHPERMLPSEPSAEAKDALSAKEKWIHTAKTESNARDRHRAIEAANQVLRGAVETRAAELEAELANLSIAARATAVLDSREYAFCLYPEQDLRQRMTKLVDQAL
ncbi:hypothetical protein NG895_14385 [Aeoliella sp. ICT_H6.2]|uniref:Uncharacterized protein n=1 Tax=Aeoliella straminimaris TaxID=2954799 RepID=A0A9X2F9X5_9BACT|nr:hypothetical protein [Aeoliella straminimaris]MCO6045095.1 hypothetical protein [Aeoliella straminimaris]